MNLRQHLLRTAAAWAALLLFMGTLHPNNLPVVMLIVPFVLLFAAFYSLWNLLRLLRERYFAAAGGQKERTPLGLGVCLAAVFLIVLQSLGQLTLRDVVTVLAIFILGYLYLTRTLGKVVRKP